MTRLTSIEKGGYYAFPDEHLPALASLFPLTKHGGKFIDPCAGEGRALDHLARAWNLAPYANEIDNERAAACRALFGSQQTVHGDMYQLKASNTSFVAAWVNPPYAWDKTGNEKRREFGMLKHALKWVQPDGYCLWCVYGHHVTLEAATFLAKHSSQVDVWRIPGLHLGEYTHIVAVAKLGLPADDPAQIAMQIFQAGQANAWPELTVQATPCYEFPAPITRKTFVFAPKVVPPDLALQFVQESGVQFNTAFQELVTPEKPPEKITPVVRPRGGQLALILAAGLFNGLVLPTDKGRMAVRSTVESVEVLTEGDGEVDDSDETTVEREVYRTQSVVTITLLGEDGSVDDISGDGPIANFIKTHKSALMDYLDEHFSPLYHFDYSPYKATLARSKRGKLFQTQKHVIAACATALQQRKSVILVGEPGVGKTICGATLAAVLQPQMKPGQVVIVMAPPHLVEKWEREAREATPHTFVKILKNVDDVRAFMDKSATNPPNVLNIGIVSREAAKLAEGWAIAVNWRKVRLARWPHNAPRPTDERDEPVTGERMITAEEPLCPTCGALIAEGDVQTHDQKRGKKLPKGRKERKPIITPTAAKATWLERVPRFCAHCGAALWAKARTFSKGKKIGNNLKNPRTPLAEFIATRYRERLYLYIIDELHEAKSVAGTDQGEAMAILANAATKTIGLTGTLFGGVASSLYGIEYIFNPRIRAKYPWGRGATAWVRDMGSLERVVEYKPDYDKAGVYSGKRRIEHKPREAPGCSPLLVAQIIDHCVFVGLGDLGRKMPDFEEIPVPITADAEVVSAYGEAKKILGQYLFQRRLEGDSSALGMYLQTLLSWPSAPYRSEPCIHRKRLDRDSDTFVEIPVHTIPALPEDRLYTKEQWLIETVREELAQGRGVAVFVRQTGSRNIQPRIAKLLTDHIPFLAKPYILKGSVKADQRESLLNRQVASGINVLIANPELVKTGLDLVDFPTIVFYEVSYSLYTMGQASRRAWRLIQDRPCKVFYPYLEGLMENQAVELIARKQQAAALLYGESNGGGLSALNGDDGGNLLATLAAEIGSDSTVTDLRDLFARHAQDSEPAESTWLADAPDDAETFEPELTETAPLPQPCLELTPAVEQGDPLLMFLAAELDSLFTSADLSIPLVPVRSAAMPPRPARRRRKIDLLAVPADDLPAPLPWREAPPLKVLHNPCPEPGKTAAAQLPPLENTVQLSLF